MEDEGRAHGFEDEAEDVVSLENNGIQRGDVDYGVVSDVGQVRTENQDHYGALEPGDEEQFRRKGRLVVVCDGMGGHNGGTIASRTAVEHVLKNFEAATPGPPKLLLQLAINKANKAVREKQAADPALRNMGTTLVAAVARGEHCHFAHVGDSRVYLFREGGCEQISRDHTYLNDLIDIGLLTPEKAKNHPERNIITRCVGMADSLQIDFNYRKLEEGDVFLFCSDGLYNHVEDDEMASIATSQESQRAAQELTDLANKRGGEDNITVTILRINEIPEADDSLDGETEADEEAREVQTTHVAEVSPTDTTPRSGVPVDEVGRTPRAKHSVPTPTVAEVPAPAPAPSPSVAPASSSSRLLRLAWPVAGFLVIALILIEFFISRY